MAATMQPAMQRVPTARHTHSGLNIAAVPRPFRPRRCTRRLAVVVHANLLARVTGLLQSYANNVVSSQEDPERLLDQVVNEMQEDLVKMREATAQVITSQKQLEAKHQQTQTTADEWLRRAELAVQKEEDDLAKEALRRRKAHQDSADGLRSQLEQQQTAINQLLANTCMLESKLAEAKSKKETLKARAASAKTSKQIQEMIGSLSTSNAVVAFEKMEEKVLAMEAEAKTTALLVGGDRLDSKLAALDAGPAARLASPDATAINNSSSDGSSSNISPVVHSGNTKAPAVGSRHRSRKQQQQEQEAVVLRLERARAKAQAVIVGDSVLDSSQPTSQLFADWSTGPPQHRPWRAAAAGSYAEVIAAEFYALDVIDQCMKTAVEQHSSNKAMNGLPAIIDVEAFKVAAAKAPRKQRLLKSASPASSRTGAALIQAAQAVKADVQPSSSALVTASTAVAAKPAAKASKGTRRASTKAAPVVVRSRASLFSPARLLEPWLPNLRWMESPKQPPGMQDKKVLADTVVALKKPSRGTKGTKGTSIKRSKQGSTTRRHLKDAAAALATAPEDPSESAALTPQMKAAQTRARNRAALYSDPEQLQQLLLEKWSAGQERVWLPVAEEAAIAAIGERIKQLSSSTGAPAAPPKGEQLMGLPALVDAVAQDSLRAQFGNAVTLPEVPYYDMASLKMLIDSRCRKARRLWARVCDAHPGRQFSKDEAAADQAVLQEWPQWSLWVNWFWDHPTYTPCPYRRSTLVIRTADKPELQPSSTVQDTSAPSSSVAATLTTSVQDSVSSSSSSRTTTTISSSRTIPADTTAHVRIAATSDTGQATAVSNEDPTLVAVKELLSQFAEERRAAEAAFLEAMQQQHQQLAQLLDKHHAQQCALLEQQHTQQVQLRSSDATAQKQFAKDQMDMVLQFQKKFASDQVEFLRLLSGIKR